jgi:hypothetical protein
MVMEAMHRFSLVSQREIGRYLGDLEYSVISRERKRFREAAELAREVARSMEKVERLLIQR